MKKTYLLAFFPLSLLFGGLTDVMNEEELAVRYQSEHHRYVDGQDPKRMHKEDRLYEGILQASFTYWIAQEDGLAAFRTNRYSSFIPETNAEKGNTIFPHFTLRPGFKVAAGMEFVEPHLTWLTTYTWFNNDYNNWRTYEWANEVLYDTYSIWLERNTTKGAVRWRNWFQSVDMNLMGHFMMGSRLRLCPSIGLIGAWDRQWFETYAFNPDDTGGAYLTLDQKWWGVGPFAGMKTEVDVYRGSSYRASIFAGGQVCETWSQVRPQFRIWNALTPRRLGNWYGETIYRILPMIKAEIGLAFDADPLANHDVVFYGNVLWEMMSWFNHNNMFPEIERTVVSTTLMLGGLTADVGVRF